MPALPPLPDTVAPLDAPVDLLYEDEAFLVLNKPAGLLSVPGRIARDCLEARVQARWPDSRIVHRLDMATSGVIIMAKGKEMLAALGLQFEKRRTTKRYIAVVAGSVGADSGTIDLPLRCDWPNRPLQMVCHERGKSALTHFVVMERGSDRTRLALTPVTGRSHQLRVHLRELGHPILGDEWYADEEAKARAPRLLLHAETLGFFHPKTGEPVAFSAPVPF